MLQELETLKRPYPTDTVGYTDVKMFDTPGCRNPSRDDSRQYEKYDESDKVIRC
jgi:hypothetical protein